ncbi:hypothetical protein [Paenibacillus sp. EPM92]|uniref:hypothetical protein n=1 Tax=Paenibacillus sp. EPM92 TaxID=1561195 RepID=UPI0019159187|nr:hypothetical protein [Paenibacillus sp. EPM92]
MSTDPFLNNARIAKRLVPLYLLVPVLFAGAFAYSGFPLIWTAFGLGAAGWVVAFMLRGPLSVLAMKKPGFGKTVLYASSGPLEEGVRYGLLALTSVQVSWAASLGQGWAAVEVVYVMIQVVAISALAHRQDEQALQAKAILESQGLTQSHPLWGIVERLSASAFHIGATLIVASIPWTVFILIPLHSLFNLAMVQLVKRSVAWGEAFAALLGGALLGLGLYVSGAWSWI